MHKRLSVLVSVLLAVGLLASCGSSDTKLTAKEQEYADQLAKHYADKTNGFGLTKKQADCVSTEVMKVIGSEPFTKAKVKPADLDGTQTVGQLLDKSAPSQDDAKKIAKGWHSCLDVEDLLATQMAPQFKLSTKARTCLAGKLGKGDLADRNIEASFMTTTAADSADVIKDLYTLIQACTVVNGKGGYFVDSMTASLSQSGKLDATASSCVAQHVVDELGATKLAEISVAGAQGNTSAKLQNDFAAAVQKAGKDCKIPDELLKGG